MLCLGTSWACVVMLSWFLKPYVRAVSCVQYCKNYRGFAIPLRLPECVRFTGGTTFGKTKGALPKITPKVALRSGNKVGVPHFSAKKLEFPTFPSFSPHQNLLCSPGGEKMMILSSKTIYVNKLYTWQNAIFEPHIAGLCT